MDGQINLRDANRRTIDFTDPASGKAYALNDEVAVLIARARGLHLPERHILIDGEPVAGAFADFALYLLHNHAALKARDKYNIITDELVREALAIVDGCEVRVFLKRVDDDRHQVVAIDCIQPAENLRGGRGLSTAFLGEDAKVEAGLAVPKIEIQRLVRVHVEPELDTVGLVEITGGPRKLASDTVGEHHDRLLELVITRGRDRLPALEVMSRLLARFGALIVHHRVDVVDRPTDRFGVIAA